MIRNYGISGPGPVELVHNALSADVAGRDIIETGYFDLNTILNKFDPLPVITRGVIPSARIGFAVDPANNDTITLGGHIFKFLTTLVAATTYTQIKRGGGAAASLSRLVNAVNGTTDANTVQATSQFGQHVVADAVTATSLRLRKADARGGTATNGSQNTTLAASITAGASWNASNMASSGQALSVYSYTASSVYIESQMVAAGGFSIELPFAPESFGFTVVSSAGVLRAVNEAVVIGGPNYTTLVLTMAGGASPNFQATDTFSFWAIG